jgi:hypothetical protein
MKEPYLLDVWMSRPWWPRAVKIAKAIFKAGEYFFYLLVGGLLVAYVSQVIGFVGFLFPKHYNQSAVQHVAWVIGVIFFAIGRPMGWVKTDWFNGGDSCSSPPTTNPKPATEVKGVLGTAGFFGLIGLMVPGLCSSALLVLAWFSISVSPFSPASWHHSVHIASSDMNGITDGEGGGFESSHAMLLRLFGCRPHFSPASA